MLTVLPIRYVADVQASTRFYAGLGLSLDQEASFAVWSQLDGDGGAVGIHDAAASQGRRPGTVELALVTDEPVDAVAARLRDDGYDCEVCEENFGRSVRVVDPDGVTVQIQNIDPRQGTQRQP